MNAKKVTLSTIVVLVLAAPPCTSANPRPISQEWAPLHRTTADHADSDSADAFGSDPGYHYGVSLLCSDCHTLHFSQTHAWDGGAMSGTGVPDGNWLGPVGPNPYLLKAPSSTELCLACHDGKTFAPDVVGADSAGLVQRSAGMFGALGALNPNGHNLSTDPGGDPGSSAMCNRCHFTGTMATAFVQCIDCHNPHGNASFRNLWWASAPGSEPPLGAYIRAGVTGLDRYEEANVGYPAPSPSDSSYREITNACIDCHHTFFGDYYTNASSPYKRHPGTNTEWGSYAPIDEPGANTDPAAWASGAGFLMPRLKFAVVGATDFATSTTVASDNEVFCLTCHRAHGSANPFSLRWDYGTPGSATASSGCYQCHENVLFE